MFCQGDLSSTISPYSTRIVVLLLLQRCNPAQAFFSLFLFVFLSYLINYNLVFCINFDCTANFLHVSQTAQPPHALLVHHRLSARIVARVLDAVELSLHLGLFFAEGR